MPDENGRIPPVFFNAEAWTRVFGPWDPDPVEIDPPEMVIEWTPDWSLDGAEFTPE